MLTTAAVVLTLVSADHEPEWPCTGQNGAAGECCCMVCDGDGASEANFRFLATDRCEELGGQCKHASTSAYSRAPVAKLAAWTPAAQGEEPEQVHIIGGDPEAVTIVYVTNAPAKSVVEIRPASDLESVTRHQGEWRTYSAMHIMGGENGWSEEAKDAYNDNEAPRPPAKVQGCGVGGGWTGYMDPNCIYGSAYIHTVKIAGLKPDTMYEHRPKGRKTWTRFKTPPAVGEPIAFGVVADVGATLDSLKTMRHLDEKVGKGEVDSVLFGGDLSYADGWGDLWDHWSRMGEFLWERTPTAYAAGNHEFANEQYTHYLARFPAPAAARDISGSDLWYSFEAGLAHVIVLCAYCRTERGSMQYQFLEADLASVDRSRTPWVLVMQHVPWYTSNAHHHMGEGATMRVAMEELLYANRVDVMLVGHLHAYERTYAIHGNSSVCDGITHLTIGDGGNAEGPACPWWEKRLPAWEARREYSFGHGVLDIVNHTHAQWRWYRNHDGAAQVADSQWLQPASFGKGGGNPKCQDGLVV